MVREINAVIDENKALKPSSTLCLMGAVNHTVCTAMDTDRRAGNRC